MRTLVLLNLFALCGCGPAAIEDLVWRPNVDQVPAAYLVFAGDGRFQASDGCNVLRSTYTRSGDTVAVAPGEWTKDPCSSAPTAYLQWVFEPSLEASLAGGLTLQASDGAHVLKAPLDRSATDFGLDGTWGVQSSTRSDALSVVGTQVQFLGRTFTVLEVWQGVVGFSDAGVSLVWTRAIGPRTPTQAQQSLIASTTWEKRDGKVVLHHGDEAFVLAR